MTGLVVWLSACLALGLPPDLEQLLADAPRPDDLPDASAVYLRRDRTLDIETRGRTTATLRTTVKILTAAGRRHAVQDLPWTTPYQRVTVNQARTVRGDGRVVEVGDLALRAASAGRYGDTFGDVVRYQLDFPYAEPGAVIDYEVTIADNRPLMPEGVADLFELQATDPVQSATYTLRAPPELVLASHVHGRLDSPVVRPREGRSETVWRARGLPAIVPERLRPADINQSLWVMVSATPSWEAVASRYRELAAPAYVSHTALQQLVKQLVAGAADPVRALYQYVCTTVRYGVGPLEARAPGIQPRPAYETFDQRVGDCKDQATLLLTMLREAGIKALPALLRRQNGGPLVEDVPCMLQFDHVIVAVPVRDGQYRWLDPTYSYGSPDYLPPDIQGVHALVVADDRILWADLPTFPATANAHERTADDLSVAADGSLEGLVTVTAVGGFEQSLRYDFSGLGPRETARRVADALAQTMPNASVDPASVVVTPAGDLTQPFRLAYSFRSEGYADRTQRFVFFRPAVFEQARLPAGLGAERIYPLRLAAAPERRVNRLRFRFAPELRVTEVPPGRERRESFGWFRIGCRMQGDALEYTREVELTQAQIPAETYPRWRAWMLELADADRQVVVAERR